MLNVKKTVALLLSILLLIGLIGCSAGAQELKQTEQSEQTAKPAQKAPAEDAFAGTIVTMMISQANYQDEYQQIEYGGSTGYHDEYDSSTLCSGECS